MKSTVAAAPSSGSRSRTFGEFRSRTRAARDFGRFGRSLGAAFGEPGRDGQRLSGGRDPGRRRLANAALELVSLYGERGLQSEGGSGRRDAIARVAESVGGRLESFHFAFGEHDTYVILDLPDNESAAAVALTVNAAGGATVRTVALLTPDEVDAAARRSVDYRPPGA